MSFPFDLPSVWFVLVGVLLTGYAVLDGFDLGVGALHLLARGDRERRLVINSIGPVWDGNEVWLVTGGGALFAAFPDVYATAFSGFYLAIVLLLVGLVFRAVAIEFRSKRVSVAWRGAWDVSFSASSVLSGFLIGLTLGNVAWGIPLDEKFDFAGSFLGLLHPYSLLVGVTTVALFTMHGSIYLALKTEGELQARVRRWIRPAIVSFVILYVTTTMATLVYVPHMAAATREHPLLFGVPIAAMLAIANVPREIHHGREMRAFASSCASIALLLATFGIEMYPNLVYSLPSPENSLTVWNGASSSTTLTIMLVLAVVGMPLVLAYTISIYWIFRGKVKLSDTSY